ncbi:TPA: hypothetical protein N0F65_005767 [Lagenidium giganteum]|uniref:GATA-type domain-containing protein n=1 Tax=Lagenidium giganteum TaxID=4803 RepID=A0AAV2YU53_9STRA|nr:TPA: hypothetical protein N0F65_005767 [Lagenidium giganteum]
MPKRKADSWPAEILTDPDVLSLDDEGRFVLCKVCHVHYAVHGGKKPKPVIMNSSFRTRAWDVHKERTSSHRMQKKQEEMRQHHQHHHRQSVAVSSGSGASTPITTHQFQPIRSSAASFHMETEHKEERNGGGSSNSNTISNANSAGTSTSNSSSTSSNDTSGQLSQSNTVAQHQAPAGTTRRATQLFSARPHSRSHTPTRSQTAPPRSPSMSKTTDSTLSGAAAMALMQNVPTRRGDMVHSPAGSHPGEGHSGSVPPSPRRHSGTAGFHPSATPVARQWEAAATSSSFQQRSRGAVLGDGSRGRELGENSSEKPNNSINRHGLVSVRDLQHRAPSSLAGLRWRSMHENVTRALDSGSKRSNNEAFSNDEQIRSSAMEDTAEFGESSENVAKKLKSLDDEYVAKHWKMPVAFYDRESANYKEYWGSLRDVYTSANTNANANNSNNNNNHSNNNSNSSGNNNGGNGNNCSGIDKSGQQMPTSRAQQADPESVEDSTTPDETGSGSSEDPPKLPTVVHDQALVNAIDRLVGVVSKHLFDRSSKETAAAIEAATNLTTVVNEMRTRQDSALSRVIEIQEQRLQVQEAILQHKLRKESAYTARNRRKSGDTASNGTAGRHTSFSSCSSSSTTPSPSPAPELSPSPPPSMPQPPPSPPVSTSATCGGASPLPEVAANRE